GSPMPWMRSRPSRPSGSAVFGLTSDCRNDDMPPPDASALGAMPGPMPLPSGMGTPATLGNPLDMTGALAAGRPRADGSMPFAVSNAARPDVSRLGGIPNAAADVADAGAAAATPAAGLDAVLAIVPGDNGPPPPLAPKRPPSAFPMPPKTSLAPETRSPPICPRPLPMSDAAVPMPLPIVPSTSAILRDRLGKRLLARRPGIDARRLGPGNPSPARPSAPAAGERFRAGDLVARLRRPRREQLLDDVR